MFIFPGVPVSAASKFRTNASRRGPRQAVVDQEGSWLPWLVLYAVYTRTIQSGCPSWATQDGPGI